MAYGLYTAMAILSFFFVLRFVKETRGRELESEEQSRQGLPTALAPGAGAQASALG